MPKRKRTVLTLKDRCALLDKLEKGVPVIKLAEEYGIAKQTISDIKRNKDNIRAYASQLSSRQGVSDPKFGKRKTLKKGKFVDLEKAIVKWYRQEDAVGVSVRGCEIQDAARRLAAQMGVEDFNASDGWLLGFANSTVCFSGEPMKSLVARVLRMLAPFVLS